MQASTWIQSTGKERERESMSQEQEAKRAAGGIMRQETAMQRDSHLKKQKRKVHARRTQEAVAQGHSHLQKAREKCKYKKDWRNSHGLYHCLQKICEAKGLIDDEQKWLITGSLHTLAEFMSDEDRRKFESGVKSPSPRGKRERWTQHFQLVTYSRSRKNNR